MDRKSVMAWLEGLAQDDWRMFHSDSEVQEIARNALELLKEQKETPKLVKIDGQLVTVKYGHCPMCGEGLNQEVYPHWCGFCGQAVKWE